MYTSNLVLLSNQLALSRSMDVVANNVANANTSGFKREGIEFDTLVNRTSPQRTINFVFDRATYRDASTGPIEATHNPLDLAIQGSGYFQVQTPDGSTRYTRAGSFTLNSSGELTTQAGYPVLGDGGQPVTIPESASQINVSGDGFITARVGSEAALAQLGKIGVVNFANEAGLEAIGNGLYAASEAPQPSASGSIVQGALEQSNVQPVTEITNMIKIMRAYEQSASLIGQSNTLQKEAIARLSKTSLS
ncbi:MAG: flagellar basal-body rod protein FlgF [Bdellovibrionales bacterium]